MKKNKEEIISSNLTSEELKNEVNEYLKKLNEISTQQNAFDQIKKILEIYNKDDNIKNIFPLLLTLNNENSIKSGKEYQIILIAYAININYIKSPNHEISSEILNSISNFLMDDNYYIHKALSIVIIELFDFLSKNETKENVSDFILKYFFNLIDKNHNLSNQNDNGILNGIFIIINDLIFYIINPNEKNETNDINSIQKTLISTMIQLIDILKKYKYINPYLLQTICHLIEVIPYDNYKDNFIEIIPFLINDILYKEDNEIYLSKIEVCEIFNQLKIQLKSLNINELPNQNEIIKSLEYVNQDKIIKVQVAANEALNNIKGEDNKFNKKTFEKRLSKLNLLRNLSKIHKEKDSFMNSKEVRKKIYEIGISKYLKINGFIGSSEEENLIQIKKELDESKKTDKNKEIKNDNINKSQKIQNLKIENEKEDDGNLIENYNKKKLKRRITLQDKRKSRSLSIKKKDPIKKSFSTRETLKKSPFKKNSNKEFFNKKQKKYINESQSNSSSLIKEINENEINKENSLKFKEEDEIKGNNYNYIENSNKYNNNLNMDEDEENEEKNYKSKKKKFNKNESIKSPSRNNNKTNSPNRKFKNKKIKQKEIEYEDENILENNPNENIESDTDNDKNEFPKQKKTNNKKEVIKRNSTNKIISNNNIKKDSLLNNNNNNNKNFQNDNFPIEKNESIKNNNKNLFESLSKQFNNTLNNLFDDLEQGINDKLSFQNNRINKLKQTIKNNIEFKKQKINDLKIEKEIDENSSNWKIILSYLKNENYEKAYLKALDYGDDLIFLRLIFSKGTKFLENISLNTNKKIMIRLNQISRCFMIEQQILNFIIEFYNLNMINLNLFNENELNDLMQTLFEIGINDDEIGNSAKLIYNKIKETFQINNINELI